MADIFLRNRGGERFAVPEESLSQALADPVLGLRRETPEETKAADLEAKYGTGGQQAAAFAEGAGRTLTFGLSTALERGLGVPKEDIQAREDVNPLAATAGEGAGILLPTALTLGASLPEQASGTGLRAGAREAASLTAPSLIAKAGHAAESAAAKLLPEATSTAGKVLTSGLTQGAGLAVEGALYGAGHVVHEAALGDPELTAQSALAEIGTSAALMGGLGFLGGAAGKGLSVALEKARGATTRLVDSFGTNFPNAKAFAEATEEQYRAMDKALNEARRSFRPQETEALLEGADLAGATKQYEVFTNKVKQLAEQMRASPELYPNNFPAQLEKWAAAMERSGGKAQEAFASVRDLIGAEGELEGLSNLIDSPVKAYKALNGLKKGLDTIIDFEKVPALANREALKAMKGLRVELRAALEDAATWGEAGARQAAFNRAESNFLAAQRNFEKLYTKRQSAVGSPVRRINPEAMKQLARKGNAPEEALKREVWDTYHQASRDLIEEIDRSAQHAPTGAFDKKALASTIDKTGEVFQGAQRRATLGKAADLLSGAARKLGWMMGGPAGGLVGTGAALAMKSGAVSRAAEVLALLEEGNMALTARIERAAERIAGGVERKAHVPTPEDHAKQAQEFSNLAADLPTLQEKLERATDGLQEHAPQTAQALQTTLARAVSYVASILPGKDKLGPMGPQMVTSGEERVKLGWRMEAVNTPMMVLDRVMDGTLTKEHMEALAAVHPALLNHMRTTLMNKLTMRRTPLWRGAKLSLSRFLGQPLDLSLTPKSILRQQGVYKLGLGAPPDLGSQPRGKSTQTGLGKLSLGSRMATPMDAAANRGAKR